MRVRQKAGETFIPKDNDVYESIEKDHDMDFPLTYNSIIPERINPYLGLPEAYQQVEYIQSSGTQYIDSGLSMPNGFNIIVDMSGSYGAVFGAYTDNNVDRNYFSYGSQDRYLLSYGGYTYFGTSDSERHLFKMCNIYNHRFAIIDNIYYSLDSDSTQTYSNKNMYVFCQNGNGTPAVFISAKLYSLKVYSTYDYSTLVRDFVPCYRKSDNTIGLFDVVNQVFYTNAGTGTFAKGSDVYYLVKDKSKLFEIAGNSEVENQLAQITDFSATINGVPTSSSANTNSVVFNGTATATDQNTIGVLQNQITFTANHKYLIYFFVNGTIPNVRIGNFSNYLANYYTATGGYILSASATATDIRLIGLYSNGTAYNGKVQFVVIDLTQEYPFDTPTTLTDNRVKNIIARFESGDDSGGYNTGTIKSSVLEKIETKGFNIWDEEWELGGIDNSTGAKFNATDRFRPKNYIRVEPNTNYYFKANEHGFAIWFYDNNFNFILRETHINITTPGNCYYMLFCIYNETTYNHDICINRSSSLNGIYKPFGFELPTPSFEQGAISGASNHTYDANKSDNSTRIRVVNLVQAKDYNGYIVKVNNGYQVIAQAYDSDQLSVGAVDMFDIWKDNQIVFKGYPYYAFAIRKSDQSNITPSELQASGFKLCEATSEITLPAPLELAGVGTAHNTFEVKKTEYVFTRNVWNYTFTGSESWTQHSGDTNRFYTGVLSSYLIETYGQAHVYNLLNDMGLKCIPADNQGEIDNSIAVSFNKMLLIKNTTNITSVATAQSYTSGKTVYYELATPQVIRIPKKHLGWVRMKDLSWYKQTESKGFYSQDLIGVIKNNSSVFTPKYMYSSTVWENGKCGVNSVGVVWFADANYATLTDFVNSLTDNDILFFETENEVADFIDTMAIQTGGTLNANQAKIPNAYQEVEYIESTGTQYIDTGLKGNGNSKVKIVAMRTGSKVAGYRLFGSRSAYMSNGFFISSGSGLLEYADYDGQRAEATEIVLNTKQTFELDSSSFKVDGNTIGTFTANTFTTPNNLVLFGGDQNGTINKFAWKVYSCKLYENNILVRDFIPCFRKSDQVIGLYDKVSGQFFTNQGTGTFLKGANVDNPICDVLPYNIITTLTETIYII